VGQEAAEAVSPKARKVLKARRAVLKTRPATPVLLSPPDADEDHRAPAGETRDNCFLL
jgi:hypothetical protein